MAVDSMQKRYFGFAKIRCQKCTWTYTFDDPFASLKGHSHPSFFTADALIMCQQKNEKASGRRKFADSDWN